ncbi:unnamed protein product, partial [Ectocarpus sp. 12 AP-2014]
ARIARSSLCRSTVKRVRRLLLYYIFSLRSETRTSENRILFGQTKVDFARPFIFVWLPSCWERRTCRTCISPPGMEASTPGMEWRLCLSIAHYIRNTPRKYKKSCFFSLQLACSSQLCVYILHSRTLKFLRSGDCPAAPESRSPGLSSLPTAPGPGACFPMAPAPARPPLPSWSAPEVARRWL